MGLYCGPLLTPIPPLTRTLAKKRVSGNRFSDFRVSGGPPVFRNYKKDKGQKGTQSQYTTNTAQRECLLELE